MTLPEHTNPPGKSNATASLVLGIIAVVFWFFGYSSILSVILGIVGLIQASQGQGTGIPGRHPHGGICALPHWSDRRRPGLCGLCRLRQLCRDRQHPSPVIPSTYAAAFLPRRLILELSLRLCYPIGILAALSSPRTAC